MDAVQRHQVQQAIAHFKKAPKPRKPKSEQMQQKTEEPTITFASNLDNEPIHEIETEPEPETKKHINLNEKVAEETIKLNLPKVVA